MYYFVGVKSSVHCTCMWFIYLHYSGMLHWYCSNHIMQCVIFGMLQYMNHVSFLTNKLYEFCMASLWSLEIHASGDVLFCKIFLNKYHQIYHKYIRLMQNCSHISIYILSFLQLSLDNFFTWILVEQFQWLHKYIWLLWWMRGNIHSLFRAISSQPPTHNGVTLVQPWPTVYLQPPPALGSTRHYHWPLTNVAKTA